MDELFVPSNFSDDETYFFLNKNIVDEEIELRKQEIKRKIKEYEEKIGQLVIEYQTLKGWTSPDGLD